MGSVVVGWGVWAGVCCWLTSAAIVAYRHNDVRDVPHGQWITDVEVCVSTVIMP